MSPYRGYGLLRVWWGVRAVSRGIGPSARFLARQAVWRSVARLVRRYGP